MPVLLVLEPFTFVPASVVVCVDTLPVGLIRSPLSFIDIPFGVDESAVAIGHAVDPESVVPGAVWPNLDAPAVFHVLFNLPLSLVESTVLEDLDRLDHSLLAIIDVLGQPVERGQLVDDFYYDLVVVLRIEDLQRLILEQLQGRLPFVSLSLLVVVDRVHFLLVPCCVRAATHSC